MTTYFHNDYWAPAIDVNVRRRGYATDGNPRGRSIRERGNSKPSASNLFTDAPVASDPLKKPIGATLPKSISNGSPSSTASSSIPIVTPLALTEHKKLNIVQNVQRLFAHNSISPVSSPVGSPTDDKDHVLREILSPRLDVDKNSSDDNGIDHGKHEETKCALYQRYGECEKGCIGKGATAVVRRINGSTYAVKEFRKRRKAESEKDYIKKLTSEFCISSALEHVNVVKTVDLVKDENDNWCEVMEYCAGGDLYSAIKSNHMTSIEIDCCFKQLIQGVGYLHSEGVAHRDIKPENLLFNDKGHLKITDFGVSDVFQTCWEEAAHKSRGLCGSEPYIAPEQFETKEYDARLVDIWACGIVYYCMVYQGIPFRMAARTDPNYTNYLETRDIGQYEPIEKLQTGCRELIYSILEPNPTERITIEKIKENTWFQTIDVCTNSSHLEHHHIPPELEKEIQEISAPKK